jgi:hypothetical protein
MDFSNQYLMINILDERVFCFLTPSLMTESLDMIPITVRHMSSHHVSLWVNKSGYCMA